MSAPERIWANPDHWIEHPPRRDAFRPEEYAEYVRVDLCDPMQDERVKALEAENARLRDELADALTAIEECKEEIDQSIRNEYPHDHPVQERYRKRDFEANPARVFLDRRAALRDMGVE
jgi:hypothetical protein